MHEMAITQGIVQVCLQHEAGRLIHSVEVEVGALGGVVPEALEFCFEACTLGTLMEGAELNILYREGEGRCAKCGVVSPVVTLYDQCRQCGGYELTIIAGEELRVCSIDVED